MAGGEEKPGFVVKSLHFICVSFFVSKSSFSILFHSFEFVLVRRLNGAFLVRLSFYNSNNLFFFLIFFLMHNELTKISR